MTIRTQIKLDPETQQRAQTKAAELGLSFDEYVQRLVEGDVGLGPLPGVGDVSGVFDLVDEGPATNIARRKDAMIGNALRREHRAELRPDSAPARQRQRRR